MKIFLALLHYVFVPLLTVYVVAVVLAWFFQEKLLFAPRKLSEDFRFNFAVPFEEVWVDASDGVKLHGVLFPSEKKRLLFYLHGNAGAADSWGTIAPLYGWSGYDLFLPDYRGFGKSGGRITSELAFMDDMRQVFKAMLTRYGAENIVVVGYSIGGAPATMLAHEFPVAGLVLKSTFYSLTMVKDAQFGFLPDRILRYRFDNATLLREVQAPVLLLHGERDEIIPMEHAIMLAEALKPGDRFRPIANQTHNGMNHNPLFHQHLREFLLELDTPELRGSDPSENHFNQTF